jgi:anthranilate phosphoribosyltransferase
LSALRSKGATGTELSSMADVLLNACKLPVERPNLFMVDTLFLLGIILINLGKIFS